MVTFDLAVDGTFVVLEALSALVSRAPTPHDFFPTIFMSYFSQHSVQVPSLHDIFSDLISPQLEIQNAAQLCNVYFII